MDYPAINILLSIVGAILVAMIVGRLFRRYQLHQIYQLRWWQCLLIAADTSGFKSKTICVNKVFAKPDAIFLSWCGFIVGEYKSGNQLKLRDFFQLQLYLGSCRRRFPFLINYGVLRYRHQCYRFRYNPTLYRQLIGMRDEAINAVSKGRCADFRTFCERFGYSSVDLMKNNMIN